MTCPALAMAPGVDDRMAIPLTRDSQDPSGRPRRTGERPIAVPRGDCEFGADLATPLTWAWPEQAMRSLLGLLRAWHAAREQRLPAIPAEEREPLETEFRRAVTVGLAAVSRVPGPKNQVMQQPGRELLEFGKTRQPGVLRFTTDASVWPTNNISASGAP